jgi:hypothetical protein
MPVLHQLGVYILRNHSPVVISGGFVLPPSRRGFPSTPVFVSTPTLCHSSLSFQSSRNSFLSLSHLCFLLLFLVFNPSAPPEGDAGSSGMFKGNTKLMQSTLPNMRAVGGREQRDGMKK